MHYGGFAIGATKTRNLGKINAGHFPFILFIENLQIGRYTSVNESKVPVEAELSREWC
jgi:hypothetical protein